MRRFLEAMIPFIALAIVFPIVIFGTVRFAYWVVYEQPSEPRGPQEIIGESYINKVYGIKKDTTNEKVFQRKRDD